MTALRRRADVDVGQQAGELGHTAAQPRVDLVQRVIAGPGEVAGERLAAGILVIDQSARGITNASQHFEEHSKLRVSLILLLHIGDLQLAVQLQTSHHVHEVGSLMRRNHDARLAHRQTPELKAVLLLESAQLVQLLRRGHVQRVHLVVVETRLLGGGAGQ